MRTTPSRPKLFCMDQRLALLMFVVAGAFLAADINLAAAQAVQPPEAPQTGAILTKLSPPIYPALARQARIDGDVELRIGVRLDGGVESAVIENGHPMLAPAALESAQKSKFECRGCRDAVTSCALKYKFQITSRGYPKDCDYAEKQPPAEVDLSHHQVTVSAWAMQICDPASRIIKVRSAKCLYLWRCGTRDED